MLTEREQETQRRFRGMVPVEQLLWTIQELRQEREKLIAFAKTAIQVSFDGGDLDGGEIQEMGVKHGLLKEEAYDFEKHGEIEDFENGDSIYMFTDIIKVSPKAPESTEQARAEKELI